MTTFTVNYGQGNIEKREAESAWELATEVTNEGLPHNQSSIKILDEKCFLALFCTSLKYLNSTCSLLEFSSIFFETIDFC